MGNRLSILMKIFGVSNKDLSEVMHIDSSLISKWRTGSRILKPKSTHTFKIASYIMELDKQYNNINICQLLVKEYEHIFSCSEKEIEIYLRSWLTSEKAQAQKNTEIEELRYSDSVSVSMLYKCRGGKGRREAVKYQLDYAIANSPGMEILCYSEEEASWLYDSPEFLKEWIQKNLLLLQSGCQIRIIHPMTRTTENTAISIFTWMPLHLTGNAHAFYIPKYSKESFNFTTFLIPNHLAVFNMSSKNHGKNAHTYITNDDAILDDIQGVMQEFFDKSLPVFRRYSFKLNTEYFNDLIGEMDAKKLKYLYGSAFPFFPISESLIREILLCNDIFEDQISHWEKRISLLSSLMEHPVCRYFISIKRIKNRIQQDYVILDSFSFLIGKTISVSRELYFRMINEVLGKLQSTDNIEIGISESDILYDLDKINVLAQETSFANFFSTYPAPPISVLTKELTVASAVFEKLENMWEAIPQLNRKKNFVCRQIRELMDTEPTGKNGIR